MKDRFEIQSFDFADGGRSWHVYDNVERYHIHTATHGFLNDDHSVPICCVKICEALNAIEKNKPEESYCPECGEGNKKILGFPWCRCECGYLYDGNFSKEKM